MMDPKRKPPLVKGRQGRPEKVGAFSASDWALLGAIVLIMMLVALLGRWLAG